MFMTLSFGNCMAVRPSPCLRMYYWINRCVLKTCVLNVLVSQGADHKSGRYCCYLWIGHDCNHAFFFSLLFINVTFWSQFSHFFRRHKCVQIVYSVGAPSLSLGVLACMPMVEFWPGRESPESISGPFNRTPCRKGFNLLIREASEVRSCCRCHSQWKLWEARVSFWQLVIQETKAKIGHSLMILWAPCAAPFFSFIF